MRNPNHYGTITKMKGTRRRPWIVKEGVSGLQKVIGYAATREEAMMMLADYNRYPINVDERSITVGQLHQLLMDQPDERLTPSMRKILVTAWNYVENLQYIPFLSLKLSNMQHTVDSAPNSVRRYVKQLWTRLEQIAYEREIIKIKKAGELKAEYTQEKERVPFTIEEARQIISRAGDPIADLTIILLYTGFRVNELLALNEDTIDLDQMLFRGGSKTKAGKNRIVPIHHEIVPIVQRLMEQYHGRLYDQCYSSFRLKFIDMMHQLGTEHTVHETRHTVRSRLDSLGANSICIDRILGHATTGSIGATTYTHKTIEELRATIELLHY